MKQIQFNQHHRVALFCNSQNEKFCFARICTGGFQYLWISFWKNELLQNHFTTQTAVIIKQRYAILKWLWYLSANTHTMHQK